MGRRIHSKATLSYAVRGLEMARAINNQVVSLLRKPSEERNPIEIEIVQEWLKKKCPVLKGIQSGIGFRID